MAWSLLIRLCAPMQSWGTRSRFVERDTELEPSKSGVVGVLCAALGRGRDEDVSDLAALLMGVRVDREGVLERDYHTARGDRGVLKASGSIGKEAVLSNRYYLADADFLVGLEGERELLGRLEAALAEPRWQIFFGRKSMPPSLPLVLPGGGLRELPVAEALEREPWPLRPSSLPPWRYPRSRQRLRLVLEVAPGTAGAEVRNDQPLGAAFRDRTFGPRPVVHRFIEKEPDDVPESAAAPS
jgi:CRISPR system Cascade subunit CasD